MKIHKFTVKNGICPETIDAPLFISTGDKCLLVFADKSCTFAKIKNRSRNYRERFCLIAQKFYAL